MAEQRSPKPPVGGSNPSRPAENAMIKKINNFLKEVKIELKKVSWPNRAELLGSTTVVIVTVSILAVIIGFWDLILSRVINALIR